MILLVLMLDEVVKVFNIEFNLILLRIKVNTSFKGSMILPEINTFSVLLPN